MQQRYYDPSIGRFLSVDPVTANPKNGINFNRYWYGSDNPYRFKDPDGRYTCEKDVCNQVRPIVKEITKARDSFGRGTKEFRQLSGVLKHLGKENDGTGPTIVSGSLKDPKAAQSDQQGKITIDFSKLPEKTANFEGGRSLVHETQHDKDGVEKGVATTESEVRTRETDAYRAENSFMKASGMQMTDKAMQSGIDQSVDDWVSRNQNGDSK